jgi:glycosyltransferase involved in cell wall biosynthesis
MNRHLIICIPSLRLGGAAKIALNLAEYFIDNTTNVTLILTDSIGKELEFKDVPAGVSMISLKESTLHRYIRPFVKAFELAKLFKRLNPDATLAVRHDATVISYLARKIAGNPGRYFIREINPITKTLERNRLMVKLVEFAYKSADGIIANSKDVADALITKNWLRPAKILLVDNPVITKTFHRKSEEEANDVWLNSSSLPLFITIGRLDLMKDHATLIKAFAKVKAKVDCRLLIIGEGKERENLKSLIDNLNVASAIKLAGAIENPYPYLKRAEVFVLSSTFEGFGNVLVEALSLGKKIVSTNCAGGPAYILNYGEFGRLVNVGDVEALANNMFESLSLNTPPKPLTDRAEMFSAAVIGQKYADIMFVNDRLN